jgi:HlyD family secretion protein
MVKKRVIFGLLVLAATGGAVYGLGFFGADGNGGPAWRVATVDRGRIVNAISSTGKLRPVTMVQVGSQVSGQISRLLADFNTAVTAGQVIARIDPASFEAKVAEARADLAVAQANVAVQRATLVAMEADIEGARAALAEAEKNLVRRRQLFERRVAAESDIEKAVSGRDQARSRLDGTRARLEMEKAQLLNAIAQSQAKEAMLRQRELDRDHTFIRSPVNGVVISRNVDIGQTVAASLQAPVLFVIAEDLRRMEVEVSVDEADIGRIREGQTAIFTVDAFPAREFTGRVRQIRKAPVEVSNVVTYAVVVTTDNDDLTLLPGMTANVSIVSGERNDVLRVANAALRFRPAGADAPVVRSPAAAAQRSESAVRQLTESLALRPDQQAAVRAIMAETGRRLRALREAGAPAEERRAAADQARAASRTQIEALLDDAQRKRYRATRNSREAAGPRRGRVWIVDGAGAPKPVNVMVGLSDATLTEIVSGDVKPGDRVIVGAGSPAAGAGPTGRFRLRL